MLDGETAEAAARLSFEERNLRVTTLAGLPVGQRSQFAQVVFCAIISSGFGCTRNVHVRYCILVSIGTKRSVAIR